MATLAYQKIARDLLSGLDTRGQDIVQKRFGFGIEEPLTLESIGQSHRITRERVRQIVDAAISSIKTNIKERKVKSALFEIFDYVSDTLKKSGNLKREDLLLKVLGSKDSFAYITFLMHLGDQFLKHKETDDVHQFWATEKGVIEKVSQVLRDLLDYFEKKKQAIELRELEELFKEAGSLQFSSFLEVSKHIVKTHDGKWGLKRWPHVYPRTIRDKAHMVLAHTGKPLHFRDVATMVEEFQKKFPEMKIKKILPQTVHNELIKDKRFILVGRGTYALSHWGYKEGTVKDIMSSILKEKKGAMTKNELIKETLKQRKVKESTILLNLQDKKIFAKDEKGRYYRREN